MLRILDSFCWLFGQNTTKNIETSVAQWWVWWDVLGLGLYPGSIPASATFFFAKKDGIRNKSINFCFPDDIWLNKEFFF